MCQIEKEVDVGAADWAAAVVVVVAAAVVCAATIRLAVVAMDDEATDGVCLRACMGGA